MGSVFLEQSIPELIRNVGLGTLSFRDMVDATVQVINDKEADTLAWVRFDLDKLRLESEQAFLKYKGRGHLLGIDGIPFGVKDIFNTKSFPTQMGSPLWKNFTPGNNSRVVDSLLFAGGLVAGKTVTAEFAVHALNETLNPHDSSKTPGTSSSGSAAAVATGMVPFALASQTAGSIIRPASFCGVWGMKPSFGMIPRTGVLKTTDSLDTVGFVAAHAKSLRTVLDITRVKGPDYPYVYKNVDRQGVVPKASDRPWRVGFVKTHTWDTATIYARKAIEDLASRIGREDGFEVGEIEWPSDLHAAHDIHSIIYNKSLSYYFQNEKKMDSQVTPIMKKMIEAGESISPAEFRLALARQESHCERLDQLLSPYDIVLSLGTSSSAPLRGVEELPDPSLIWTLGHIPSVAAPVFRCPEGLPFGAQFVSRKWNDYLLVQGIEELVDRGILPPGSQKICLH
ncbi:amidase, Asp-tRNAAsn/Glu-tRNAGln amidotransferase A subunit [Sulfuricella denitrificans skB26]|uniref:Amidase, Asp-tRNAAsn/Glu-tRNAGln amidotransferase A subunit n=1 Tax=Sulfuricella denitrificans (strain DSM 22764 / NBRC 105220 / skB26) TaxID=1163617 RepID=S6ADS0_SULDS|nr:amidase [Sulfuricella denitrificans]BAN36693.1 amidase, Asp-tRNAAsn/Glu-tRNAGln amidotransferase A subunit [Sulfuricella denitrificans skB26]